MSVAQRVERIRQKMAESARAAGRDPQDITLVAVCKRQPFARILEAYQAGIRDFGENTAQGLRETAERFDAHGCSVRWHFIGALQRNKVNLVLARAGVVHSIDSVRIAEAISKRAQQPVDVLVQVNIAQEPSKSGVAPQEVGELVTEVAELPGLRLRGLMAIPPADEDPTPYFQELAATLRRLQHDSTLQARGVHMTELSMGMSHDFAVAIRHGATLVRVGTSLFGPRPT